MRKKILALSLSTVILLGGMMSMVSCGGEPIIDDDGNDDNGGDNNNNQDTSKIKSLTAKNAEAKLKIDEVVLITNFYTITANSGSLTSAEKLCTYSSSNTEVVSFLSKQMRAVGLGQAEITVTSKVDTSKSCKFTVTVSDVYFDRNNSSINSDDDLSKELIAEGGVIRTKGLTTDNLYVKGSKSTTQYMESTFKVHSVSESEKFPKFGVVFNTFDYEGSNVNQVYVFMDGPIDASTSTQAWNSFGCCEVASGEMWAWNGGVTNATARCLVSAYEAPAKIGFETEFKIGVTRVNLDFNVWVNDVYAFSFTTLDDLFGVTTDGNFKNVPSSAGLFEFNSDVTMSNYSYTDNADTITAKINSITEKRTIGVTEGLNWTED